MAKDMAILIEGNNHNKVSFHNDPFKTKITSKHQTKVATTHLETKEESTKHLSDLIKRKLPLSHLIITPKAIEEIEWKAPSKLT